MDTENLLLLSADTENAANKGAADQPGLLSAEAVLLQVPRLGMLGEAHAS